MAADRDSRSLRMMRTPPNEREAREQGCTCEWFGGGSIVLFSRSCAILHLHKFPEQANWLPIPRSTATGGIDDGS